VLLALAVVCAILVAGLAIVSRGAPSAAQFESVALQTPEITATKGCANFASFWTVDTGVNVPIEAIEGLTNCRLSTDGTWFVPNGADDPRLSDRSVLTDTEQARVETLRSLLMADLLALDQALPNSVMDSLEVNYAAENLPVFGHTKRGRVDFGVKHARYQRIAQAFLLSPRRAILADYVGWLIERRSTAAGQFEASCMANPDFRYLLRACRGIRNEFGVTLIPIFWELNNRVLIQEYLAWSARSGEPIPVASPTLTTR
jgi:hypothetical protein